MKIPLTIRAGGAFMALAITLALFLLLSILSDGFMAPFAVTPRFLLICVAAIIFGAFATVRKDQAASKAQVIALAVAVILVIISMLLPQQQIYVLSQGWLTLYAVGALVCALILRRAAIPS